MIIRPYINKIIITLLLTGILLTKTTFAKDVDIRKYGAVADGKTVNSAAIQAAIDDCSKSGGGKAFIPAGNWLCGTILLKDGVVLSLDEKAVLSGSTNIADYFIVDGFTDGTGQLMGYCFIGAVSANKVGIEGKGIINGQGKLVLAANGRTKRPFLVRFVNCNQVVVKDVHLQASTAWTMHLFRSKNVKVEGLVIYSRGLANNDGIDIDCCEEVVIRNCEITSDDDAICFKTTSPFPCKNIVVSGIKIRTNCGAIKFGTESTGDFQHIKVSGIAISYAGLGAVKILSVDGSHISNIDISGIEADTVNVAIMIRLGARLKTFRPGDLKKEAGTISNVTIRNVKVKHASLAGILFSGVPGHSISGISLENIAINIPGGGMQTDAKIKLAENESAYPETRMFGKIIPAYGLYIRHANDLQFKQITVTTDEQDARPALIAEDVQKINLSRWKLPNISSAEPVLQFITVSDAVINSFQMDERPSLFLNIEGKESRNIYLQNFKFLDDNNAVKTGNDVRGSAVIRKQ
ncbi:MAG: right-handed parallel beta-helix repeat-containing protein [Ferruginibacter sp.]|nr:right-handed parallel beta-helix repeat-containing protein [Ferruginibacter sp.]